MLLQDVEIYPAHAGINLRPCTSSRLMPHLTRTRGDKLEPFLITGTLASSTPRMRGWFIICFFPFTCYTEYVHIEMKEEKTMSPSEASATKIPATSIDRH